MQTIVKIPRRLFEQAKADLFRPHAFAMERVGFFSTRCTRTKSITLVHCIEYHSVEDAHYIQDDSVGACIGSDAILRAMSRSRRNSVGQVHVHWHGGSELPEPSPTDTKSLPHLAVSLRNANKAEAHGWMILGENDSWTSLHLPTVEVPIVASSCVIVGFPMSINRRPQLTNPPVSSVQNKTLWERVKSRIFTKDGSTNYTDAEERYERQSFLGPDSDAIIGGTRVGVIGLCGGGSPIVQQLAHLGFRNFVFCDDDLIDRTNLNRLIGGTLKDVDERVRKIDIACRTVRSLHKNSIVEVHFAKWQSVSESLLDCDIVFGCLDQLHSRRDLEGFCRRNLICYFDIGLDVAKTSNAFEINGQAIMSMPGCWCMRCSGFLSSTVLDEEARAYGAAGGRPQVVWSNGVLSSTAVGFAVDLITDWSKTLRTPPFMTYKGSTGVLKVDNLMPNLVRMTCRHYPFSQLGDSVAKSL